MDDILHFWLDELETFASFRQEYLFEGMDCDNSNVRQFEDYVAEKSLVQWYLYKITFIRENHPLFAYYKGDAGASVRTRDYVCAYSSAFRILWETGVREFVEKHFEIHKLRRFDVCLDLPYPISRIDAEFPTPKQKHAEFSGSGWALETRYIGEKRNSLNKRQLVRVYDKIADTVKKGKQLLYSEYLTLEAVTRVELEIRSELAKNVEFHEAFDRTRLLRIFKNYLSRHTAMFDGLPEEPETLFRKRETVDGDAIQDRAYWTHKAKLLRGIAKNMLKVGICPVEMLMKDGILAERTKAAVWYKHFALYQKDLQKRIHWNRNVLPKFR